MARAALFCAAFLLLGVVVFSHEHEHGHHKHDHGHHEDDHGHHAHDHGDKGKGKI